MASFPSIIPRAEQQAVGARRFGDHAARALAKLAPPPLPDEGPYPGSLPDPGGFDPGYAVPPPDYGGFMPEMPDAGGFMPSATLQDAQQPTYLPEMSPTTTPDQIAGPWDDLGPSTQADARSFESQAAAFGAHAADVIAKLTTSQGPAGAVPEQEMPFDRMGPDQPPNPPFTRLNLPGLPGMALPVAPVPPKPVPPSEEEQKRVLEGRPFTPEAAVSELGKFLSQQGGQNQPGGVMDVVIPEEQAGRIVRYAESRGGRGGAVGGDLVRSAGPASSYEPSPQDFSAYMQSRLGKKKRNIEGAEIAEGPRAKMDTTRKAEEDYYAREYPYGEPPSGEYLLGSEGEALAAAAEAGQAGARRAAAESLARSRGTAEQAAQLRPEEVGRAGNVNLAVFPPEVRGSVARTVRAKANNEMAGARRGVVSDPEASLQAAEVAARMTVPDWLKTRPGRAFSQPEVEALGDTITQVTGELDALKARRTANRAQGIEDRALEASIAEKALESGALIGVFSGASAEAGRALRQFRGALEQARGTRLDAVKAAFRAIGTNEEAFAEWVQRWEQTDPTDLRGRYALLQALHKPSAMDKLLAWTVSNMLSGPKSVMIQGVSGLTETVNRPLVTLLDGDARAAASDVVGMANAVGKAFGAAKGALLTGIRESQVGEAATAGRLDTIRPEAFPGKAGLVATPALRVIGAEDEFFRQLNAAGAAANYASHLARSTGKNVDDVLADPPAGMLAYVDRESRRAVYEGEASPLAKKLIELRQMATTGKSPGEVATGLAVNVLVPFVKIPDVIYRTGVGMLAEPVVAPFARGVQRGLKGEQAVQRGDVGRQRLATLLLTGYFGLAAAGNLTGNGPTDPGKRRVLMEARDENGDPVWQPHAVRVAGRRFDYTNLGPAAIPMAAMGNAVEAYRETGRKVDPHVPADLVNKTAGAMHDASYVDTVGKILTAVGEGRLTDVPKQLGQSALGRFVPYGGALAQAARTMEGEIKETRGPLEAVAARIPGLAEGVPSRIGPFGEPVEDPQDAVSTLSPIRSGARGTPNPAAVEMGRQEVGVGRPDRTVAKTRLTEEQYRAYEIAAGRRIREAVDKEMGKPGYAQLVDAEKKKRLQAAVEEGRAKARAEVEKKLPKPTPARRPGPAVGPADRFSNT